VLAAPPKVGLERAANSPFASQLPLENGAPFGRSSTPRLRLEERFGCKNIYFILYGFYPSLFDNNFFQKDFVKVVFPGKHQFVCCRILICGRDFKNVHNDKKRHMFSSFLFYSSAAMWPQAALACQEKPGGLDRPVEGLCQIEDEE
jgi:hypothetical protein